MGVMLTFAADVARTAVRGTSYQVIEVPGWRTSGHGPYRVIEGVVGHHTGTSESAKGDYPSLNVVTKGRSDLPGPLCTYGLGRNGTIFVVSAGVAWHAGASAYGGFADLNDEFAGIEAESAGTGLWTPAQLDCYPRLVGAFLSYIRRDVSRYCSHRACAQPAGRKPDPKGLSDAWMQNAARAWMGGAPAPAPVKPAPAPSGVAALPTLRKGEKSAAVLKLQQFLTSHFPSYNAYAPTGFYGDSTQAGVREFQKRAAVAGSPLDGSIVGNATNAKLWAFGYRG
jgi:hypothetical protein